MSGFGGFVTCHFLPVVMLRPTTTPPYTTSGSPPALRGAGTTGAGHRRFRGGGLLAGSGAPGLLQSSSGPKAGCYFVFWAMPRREYGFQSSSGPKAGCYYLRPGSRQSGNTFQSSSGPKAGCYNGPDVSRLQTFLFQSSSGPKAGCYEACGWHYQTHEVFQSSSGPKAGCYVAQEPDVRIECGFNPHPARRPDATLRQNSSSGRAAAFQSSSGPKAGCYWERFGGHSVGSAFQSSSGPKAGCYATERVGSGAAQVSILIRPEGRTLRVPGTAVVSFARVSILIRPEGRMLLLICVASPMYTVSFQSSSGPKAGCYPCIDRLPTSFLCFNPHPARRPDAT